jgi:hypothetical protein
MKNIFKKSESSLSKQNIKARHPVAFKKVFQVENLTAHKSAAQGEKEPKTLKESCNKKVKYTLSVLSLG